MGEHRQGSISMIFIALEETQSSLKTVFPDA
jgi:hypothetical protein